MIAVVVVRGGELPLGGDEAVAEAGGTVVIVGDGTDVAARSLAGIANHVTVVEQATFRPAALARGVAALVSGHDVVVLPASPDGRDLAPRIAHALGRPLLAGAVAVRPDGAEVARFGGLVLQDVAVEGPFVATLQPGVRGTVTRPGPGVLPGGDTAHAGRGAAGDGMTVTTVQLELPDGADPTVVAVLDADPATMDLSEAARIVAGGAGLGSADAFELARHVGLALGASAGATRVITDWGWAPLSAQIGTTGVTVQPRLYVAFGISGAVQHIAGLGQPDHVIAVNLDRSCPMMAMADLAVVADAPAVLAALAAQLGAVPAGEVRAHG